MKDFFGVLNLYPERSLWITLYFCLRFLVCPFRKLESILPKEGLFTDIGCGYGIFANLLSIASSKRKVFGYDLSVRRIGIAKTSIGNRKNVHFAVADATV